MSKLNTPKSYAAQTHEGGAASLHLTPEQQLRRSVMSCFLWEKEFYTEGEDIAARITKLAREVPLQVIADVAFEARHSMHLRHVPLLLLNLLVSEASRRRAEGKFPGSASVGDTIAQVIGRADEIPEFLAMYWRDGKKPIAAQVKRGLALAFGKFSEYSLAKYDRDGAVKLRDVLRMVRPKPATPQQAALYKRVLERTLETPDTWEVQLSGGADKKETFERLIREKKLGYFALLRNLRNMAQAGCDPALVDAAVRARQGGAERVLPFRYVAAVRAAPMFAQALDAALLDALKELTPFSGVTAVLVDVSGSMDGALSAKSDLTRRDAAATLAAIIPGQVRVFAFADAVTEVPAYRGLACIDAIARVERGGTRLFDAVDCVNRLVPYDRIIVITDEQSHPAAPSGIQTPWGGQRYGVMGYGQYERSVLKTCPAPLGKGYMINVASAKNGVGYDTWTKLDGFSENIIRYIAESERAAF